MILAGIAANYHWPKADLEALTADDMRFWNAAMGEFQERVKEQVQQ